MVPDRCNYFWFWAIFYPFILLTARKIKNLKRTKGTAGDIVILHMCTKNYDQMVYGSSDMVRDRCNCYFSFWAIFCSFNNPLTAPKIKILKKWKKTPGDIIILHMCTKRYDQMMHGFWYIVRDRCDYFSFWAIFCPFILLTARKIKI